MKKKGVGPAKVALAVAVVVIALYLIYAFFTGTFPFGAGHGENVVDMPAHSIIEEEQEIAEEPEAEVVDEPETIEELPSLIIEISEDRIIFDGEELSLEDLEEILRRYASAQDIWGLHDVYRADRATYESVRELLRRHDVIYRER